MIIVLNKKLRLLQQAKIIAEDPAKFVFAFDLHGILLKQRLPTLLYVIKDFIRKGGISLIYHRPFWYFIAALWRKPNFIEYNFDRFVQQYPTIKPLKQIFIQALVMPLDDDVMLMLKTLYEHGYALYVLSNIWPESLALVRQKYPVLDTLIKGYFIPTGSTSKPEGQFFEEFKQYVKEHEGDKQIVLIDDSQKNRKAAKRTGIIAAHINLLEIVIQYLKR